MRFERITRFVGDRSGSVAVISAICMIGILATIGVAVTYASAVNEHAERQAALDAAVLAGASLHEEVSDEEKVLVASEVFAENLKKRNVTLSSASTIEAGQSAPQFTVLDRIVRGQSSTHVRNYFSDFVGTENMAVTVESAARAARSEPVCVLAIDDTSPQAIEIYGTAVFTARNCAAQANSTNGLGMRTYGSGRGTARQFGVKGGYSGDGFTPRPITGVPTIPDPYASIPVPMTGPCVDIAAKLQNTPAVLTPGTYCGGIRIMANSQIIMEPGVYVMLDGPFRIDSNSTVNGTEVVIAFTGVESTLYLGSGAIIDLTSPTSGPYTNIQFFQDRHSSADQWVTMMGDIKLRFDGVMYFPTQDVWVGGGSTIEAKSPSYIFVVEKLWFQDNSIIDVWQENSRGLSVEGTGSSMMVGSRLTR